MTILDIPFEKVKNVGCTVHYKSHYKDFDISLIIDTENEYVIVFREKSKTLAVFLFNSRTGNLENLIKFDSDFIRDIKERCKAFVKANMLKPVNYILEYNGNFYKCNSYQDIVEILKLTVIDRRVHIYNYTDSVTYGDAYNYDEIIRDFIKHKLNRIANNLKLYQVNLL